MENLKVIGHRGARNVTTENTLASFKLAASSGIDAIEFDVRITKDKQLVVCHNENLKDVYGIDKNISALSLEEIHKVKSATGETIPTLAEVMELDIDKPLLVDIKGPGTADLVYQTLKDRDVKNEWMAGSEFPEELVRLKQLFPDLGTTLQIYKHPLRDIKAAKEMNASGITLVLYLLNPLMYRLARRAGLKILIYQNYASFLLTWLFFVRLLRVLYPQVCVITDRPDRIVPVIKKQ